MVEWLAGAKMDDGQESKAVDGRLRMADGKGSEMYRSRCLGYGIFAK